MSHNFPWVILEPLAQIADATIADGCARRGCYVTATTISVASS